MVSLFSSPPFTVCFGAALPGRKVGGSRLALAHGLGPSLLLVSLRLRADQHAYVVHMAASLTVHEAVKQA